MTLYYFPLTKQDITNLHDNKLVSKNFSPLLEPHKLLCVVAWNKSKRKHLDKKQFHNMRKAGIDVANIPLKQDDLSKIESGDGVSVYYSEFEILLLTEERLTQLLLKKRKRP